MTRLREHAPLQCPASEAEERLWAYFDRLKQPDGTARLRLRVPLRGILGLPDAEVERDVLVTVSRARDDQNINDVLRIHWEPVGGGPFPTFDGTLATWGGQEPDRESFAEVDGSYEPPLGEVGLIFDEAIGREIAHRTARAFLEDLVRAVRSS